MSDLHRSVVVLHGRHLETNIQVQKDTDVDQFKERTHTQDTNRTNEGYWFMGIEIFQNIQ